ncbi:DUF3604 domain-containing protein [Mesorhizobium sp. ZC-5]|uniref:DUF3604 domain-containing protein n=1 Tax=Mesorhizobium sp. ZC-5 TaxID=2986066 RepID=UPI002980C07A|nr:DUF3604 domain-containing protein [Mesorhizobium sp. ZC-5]
MTELRIHISRLMVRASALALFSAGTAVADPNPDRDVFFGEQHIHTSWSFDAYIFGNTKATPADAYAYAKGKPLKHALGFDMQIEQPLDWMGVTDHSEYVGVIQQANDPSTDLAKSELGKELQVKTPADIQRIYLMLGRTMTANQPIKELVSPQLMSSVWKRNNEMANAANEPGKFTAFNAYEWTSTPNSRNMHRNIYFKDAARLPEFPFSSFDSEAPEDLWAWMDKQRESGIELLAISHNANLSDGLMYPTEVDSKGRPIDAAWAESRMRNEPLIEIKQIKGASETHPLLSPNDEFANYEIMSYLLGDPSGRFDGIRGSFVRDALRNGLALEDTQGFNPYKPGFVSGSDSHNAAAPYRQDNFYGGHGAGDGDMKGRLEGKMFAGLDPKYENPAGLSALWAEENTRESLFEAMKRKETYGTSGTRIKVRFFGGQDFTAADLKGENWVRGAYQKGVPMGSDLPSAASDKAPSFLVWAVKDPTSGNLDRVQVVKGWSASGQSFEKIYDVVWSDDRKPDPVTGKVPAIASTVDVENAIYENSVGSVELSSVWTDPDFDPSVHAFYYARVLEIPTPRWTTIQAKEAGVKVSQVVPATVQERAWTSPIWYSPGEGKERTAAGVRIADIGTGGKALDQQALTALTVGKTVWLKNLVTGDVFRTVWDATGQRVILNFDPGSPVPQHFGNVTQDAYLGVPVHYEVTDGKIVESFGNEQLSWSAYQVGDRTLLARSNEFGYANYEVVPTPESLVDLNEIKR